MMILRFLPSCVRVEEASFIIYIFTMIVRRSSSIVHYITININFILISSCVVRTAQYPFDLSNGRF